MTVLPNIEDLPVIGSGKVTDEIKKKEFQYSILHGNCLRRAMRCQIQWSKAFNVMLEYICVNCKDEEEMKRQISTYLLQDAHWDWSKKAVDYEGDEYEWLFCEVADEIQGICVIYHPNASFLHSGRVFYIEFISVAPWNRDVLLIERKFSGIGSILLKHAVKLGIETLRLDPGFNLHSLPQSDSFYQKKGMVLIEGKVKQGMNCFEMPGKSAMELLNEK